MATEPQVDKPEVVEFLLRFHAARSHGRATYVECFEYALNAMNPRGMCQHVDGSDEVCFSLPGFGERSLCLRELRTMVTLLVGFRQHNIAVVIERMKLPSLMGVQRTWRLRVNVPQFNSNGNFVGEYRGY